MDNDLTLAADARFDSSFIPGEDTNEDGSKRQVPTGNGKTAPEDIGYGNLSTSNRMRGSFALPDKAEVINAPLLAFSLEFVDSRASFASALTWSAKASFSWGGGGGSVRASLVKRYQRSKRDVVLVCSKFVQRRKWFLRRPEADEEAVKLAKKRPKEFLQKYGDRYVKGVYTGGMLSLVFRFGFQSESESESFSAAAKAKWGSGKASGGIARELVRTATELSATVQGVVSGVKDAPEIFQPSETNDKATEKLDAGAGTKLVDALMKYFNDFEENVTDDFEVPLLYDFADPTTVAKMPANLPSLNDYLVAISRLEFILSRIDQTTEELHYMQSNAFKWNDHVDEEDIHSRLLTLEGQEQEVNEAFKQIADLSSDKLPITENDIAPLPPDWLARDLRPYASEPVSAQNSTDEAVIRFPDSVSHRQIGIRCEAARTAGQSYGKVVVHWVYPDAVRQSDVIHDWTLYGGGSQTNERYLRPPGGATGVRIYVISYHGSILRATLTVLL